MISIFDIKILVEAGHWEGEPGKQSPDAALGKTDSPYWYKEWIGNRRIANRICDILQAQGFDAELLVPDSGNVTLKERVRRVNEWCRKLGKDRVLLVSNHSNAAKGKDTEWKSARGICFYTTRGITKADYLADEMIAVAAQEIKPPMKVRKKNDSFLGRDFEEDFYIIRNTWCPAVLIEHFFHDNKEDVLFLNSDEGQAICAFIVAEGIINYLHKYVGTK